MAVDGPVIAGWAQNRAGDRHAVAWDARTGRIRDLGTLGGNHSEATAVSGDLVVGWSTTAAGQRHGFVFDLSRGQRRDIGGTDSVARAVDGPLVVGEYRAGTGITRAFVYDLRAPSPALHGLGTLGGRNSAARAVQGTRIVGSADVKLAPPPPHEPHVSILPRRAFLYDTDERSPHLRNLGAVGGAVAIDGSLVIGDLDLVWHGSPRGFVVDLGSSRADVMNLGEWTEVKGVSGRIVVGRAHAPGPVETAPWVAAAWFVPAPT